MMLSPHSTTIATVKSMRPMEVKRRTVPAMHPVLRSFSFKFLLPVVTLIILIRNANCDNEIVKDVSTMETRRQLNFPVECGSIDVRNDCKNLMKLDKCEVIHGFLMIVLLTTPCNYSQYSFPLKEITDYFILYDVRGLTNIVDLFPKLTVIRGRRLFLNYAMGVTRMPDLERLELKSLIAIPRGHVLIGRNPKLCSLSKIFWDRLTLSPGENHIFPDPTAQCPKEPKCLGCPIDYCWTDFVCQKFENDNVLSISQGTQHCHRECLGGCYNSTNTGCWVCRHLTDNGACVSECPPDKYLMEHYQRCYSKEECHDMRRFIFEDKCVRKCPSGYKGEMQNKDENLNGYCVACAPNEPCLKVCQVQESSEVQSVYSLADAEYLKGCTTINGSLIISIRNKVNEVELEQLLGSISEIKGHLKIFRCQYLRSLKFLKSLKLIGGEPLESSTYGFILYDNPNLQDLWSPEDLQINGGGLYIHLNNKLCTDKIKAFARKVKHNQVYNSLQVSDKDVFCLASKIDLDIKTISHRQLLFTWPSAQTAEEVEVFYHILPRNLSVLPDESDLDSDVCSMQIWLKKLVFTSLLKSNGTHYSYKLNGLDPGFKYACYIKSFGSSTSSNARSDIIYVTTSLELPQQPLLHILEITNSSLTIELQPRHEAYDVIEHYILYVHEHKDDVSLLDQRNYCEDMMSYFHEFSFDNFGRSRSHEDFDHCCTRKQERRDDDLFINGMIDFYGCSLDQRGYCSEDEDESVLIRTATLSPIILKSQGPTIYTIDGLKSFCLYGLEVKACNGRGCGSYAMLYERTNYTEENDLVSDLVACRVPYTNEYHVAFSEPADPNGAIVSYAVHFQSSTSDDKNVSCITRLQHADNNFVYVESLETHFDMVALRIESLANDVFTNWVNITICGSDGGDIDGSLKPKTKIAGFGEAHSSGSVNMFVFFFLIGAGCTLLWICYKRRLWRKIPDLRRYLPLQCNCLRLLKLPLESNDDDRQILVDGFEVIRFSNSVDDELRRS